MKALTIRQPHASLIAVGAKSIETRSWSTSYRGPLVIHAGGAKPPVEMMEDGYAGEAGDFDGRNFQWCQGEDAPASGDWYLYDCTVHDCSSPTPGEQWLMPLGAVVASCRLVDVVPITDYADEGVRGDHNGKHRIMVGCRDEAWRTNPRGGPPINVTDQLPFGDFTPGRYAWILDGVRALPEPIPCKGRQGLWTLPEEVAACLT